ncbi:DUF3710 domain-containing protein [Cryptosporangium aurantiacum]|uniref:DUF3710 domain-containing protein n=1 Tax=Cryptosporangium aurantiacum TaxID=134849 RepID=A0A1M7J257_9ACTN|nr:DUF3710 domain-containing protein [Cryptosporangium aurantiacum]SHM47025.1 Protein of unknown function [Cryptosporangium aurantiacum]
MFRRRRGRHAATGREEGDLEVTETEPVDSEDEEAGIGPWDADAAPSDDVQRVDLGALRVPTLPDVELRVEADQQGQVASVVLTDGSSALELAAFAAPRTEGIWDDVRQELEAGIRGDGGVVAHEQGEFGPELRATVKVPDGSKQLLRFVGVDGPRWFLRATFTGAAAADAAAGPQLAESVRQTVVVRGTDPMPVRDPLPLRLPREVVEQASQQQD